MDGRKFQIGNVSLFIVKKDCSYLCMWMTKNWLERNTILIRCGKYSTKKLIWENQHLSLIMYTWAVLKENAKSAKMLWIITEPCSNREFLREIRELTIPSKSSYFFMVLQHCWSCKVLRVHLQLQKITAKIAT